MIRGRHGVPPGHVCALVEARVLHRAQFTTRGVPTLAAGTETVASVPAVELRPVLSSQAVLSPSHVGVVLLFGALFLVASYMPLAASGVWADVVAGRAMLSQAALPQADVVQPLAAGMVYLPTTWLAQVTIAAVEQFGGTEWLLNLRALLVFASLVLWARVLFVLTKSKGLMVLGCLLIFAAWWPRIAVLGPEAFGSLCLAGLVWLLVELQVWSPQGTSTTLDRRVWIGVPLLVALWANLDATFPLALILLACVAVDRASRTAAVGGFKAVLADRGFHGRVWLLELSLLATLLHPLGWRLWSESLTWSGNPLWISTGGFFPLMMWSFAGALVAGVWLTVALAWRGSRLEISTGEILLLVAVSLAVAANARLLGWMIPVGVLLVGPHLADRLRRGRSESQTSRKPTAEPDREPKPLEFIWSLVCLLLVWIVFALAPVSTPVLGGKPRSVEQLYDGKTPLAAAAALSELPANALVWAPADLGDYLAFHGQRGVFAGSRLAALPDQALLDYRRIGRGEHTERLLDRYRVEAVVADPDRNDALIQALRQKPEAWTPVLRDPASVVFVRSEVLARQEVRK